MGNRPSERTDGGGARLPGVVIDGHSLNLEDVAAVARSGVKVTINPDEEIDARLTRSRALRDAVIAKGGPVYGVTTGVGDSVDRQIGLDRVGALQRNLVRKCGCGVGNPLPLDETRAAILVRANCLVKGNSGVRRILIERLLDMLNLDLLPRIPEYGSVGASGDLVPGSYIAAALIGERTVMREGVEEEAAAAWQRHGIAPLTLEPKEGLALINGSMIMSGIASLALLDAERLARLMDVCTAMALEGLGGVSAPFEPFLFEVKSHPGPKRSASFLRWLLEGSRLCRAFEDLIAPLEPMTQHGDRRLPVRIQDHYSVRCAPHCIGTLYDTVSWAREWLETEINSTNDNPIFDLAEERVHSGGNFSGFHVGLAMDALKIAVASTADQIDRQFALLVDERFNHGLTPNLVAVLEEGHPESGIHHGFKAVQLTMTALAAESQQRCMPMTAFSRSTECHNQDKVSMATAAARQARDVVRMAEHCCALQLLACCQAIDLRGKEGLGRTALVYERVREVSAFVDRDRELDGEIAAVTELLRQGSLLEGLGP